MKKPQDQKGENMPIHDTRVGTKMPKAEARTPKDGSEQARGARPTINTPNPSRCAMELPAIKVEPPAGRTKPPPGIPIEKRKEEVATAIARAFTSTYCQHADPEEIIRKDSERGEEGAYIREVEGELTGIAHSFLKEMSGHKIQMIDRGFSEVDEFITRMGSALADGIKLRRTARELREAKQRRSGTEAYSIDPFTAMGKAFQIVAAMSVNPQKFAENLDKIATKTNEIAKQRDNSADAIRFCMGKELERMLQ